jgi:tetrahydromethanopterin S-methyltransferase subunit E
LVEPFDEHILMRFKNGRRYERVDSELLDDLKQIYFCVQFGAPLDKQLVIYGLVFFAAGATVFLTAATTQNRKASPVVHHVVLEWFAAQQVVL